MKLKECCTVLTDGNWIESRDQSESGIRLVQTGNVGNGEYLEKENRAKYISEETFENLGCTEIFPGDILVSRLPDPVGRACLIPKKNERMITAVDCSILRVDETKVNKRYLLHFLKSSGYYRQISAKLAGTTRVRISRKNLEQVEVEVPDEKTQGQVVAVIDKLENVIRKRKEELEQLNELIKARFVELFSGTEYPREALSNNVEEMFIGPFGSSLKNDSFVDQDDSYCVVYEQKHAIKKNINMPFRYVDEKKYQELKRWTVLPGDILVSCRGTIGEVFEVPDDAPLQR